MINQIEQKIPKKAKISIEHSCQIRSLHQMRNVRRKKPSEMFPQCSKA